MDTSLREQVKAEIVALPAGIERLNSGSEGSTTDVQLVFKVQQLESRFIDFDRFVTFGQAKIAEGLPGLQRNTSAAGEFAQATVARV